VQLVNLGNPRRLFAGWADPVAAVVTERLEHLKFGPSVMKTEPHVVCRSVAIGPRRYTRAKCRFHQASDLTWTEECVANLKRVDGAGVICERICAQGLSDV
jgi:hypothetical protein